MLTRIIISLIAIPAIIYIIYVGKLPFYLFVVTISLLALNEYFLMLKNKDIFPQIILGNLIALAILINTFFNFLQFYDILLLSIIVLTFVELFRNKNSSILNLGGTILGIFYIVLFFTSLINLREIDHQNYWKGGFLILSMIFSIWACDSAAYFGGISLGKHKIFPRVSPKKSWEGSIFGFVFAIITMLIMQHYFLYFITISQTIILGATIGIFAQIGDLIESSFKRDVGVKDSSNLIPGHGGFFDRFDSLIYISPIIYLLTKLLKI